MKRALLISLSLVLALVGWSAVGAEDGFYVIPSMRVVPKTGQTTSYATGDDGAWQKGVASPSPRFTDNNNGTVTDNLTRLIWTKNADAFSVQTWGDAINIANSLASGSADLTDGSVAGDWRLPNLRELQSLLDYGCHNPALPADYPFTNVQSSQYGQSSRYWSSSTYAENAGYAWILNFFDGSVFYDVPRYPYRVWCVRGGK